MKRNNISIKWNLFLSLLAFAVIMLILLWLFQITLLDRFYQAIKTQNLFAAAETIAGNIDDPDFEDILIEIAVQDDICIRIVDDAGSDLYAPVRTIPFALIHLMSADELQSFYTRVEADGGRYFERFATDRFLRPASYQGDPGSRPDETAEHFTASMAARDERFREEVPAMPAPMNSQSMICGQIVTDSDGREQMILLNAIITPITSTVDTLRVQLVYISVIFIIMALALALMLALIISRPLVKINRSAKELARGNYDVTFEGDGYREITELSDTLNHAARELSKVEKLRRELLANVSHDMRTPLTMITGYGEAMRDLPGENTAENLQLIIDEARRLTTLVNDSLDLSKLQSGAQQLTLSVFNLTAAVREIMQRYRYLIEQDGYAIDFRYDEDLTVRADELKITQVIYNLINNAVTYTGDDQRVVIRQRRQGPAVRLEVIDSGEGITPEQLPFIWDRYYRADKNHRRAAIGAGLGLSIVRGILELHHCPYGVDSTEGGGSTFWFELPRLDP